MLTLNNAVMQYAALCQHYGGQSADRQQYSRLHASTEKKSASLRLTQEASHIEVHAEMLLLIKGQLAFMRQMLIVTESSFKTERLCTFY